MKAPHLAAILAFGSVMPVMTIMPAPMVNEPSRINFLAGAPRRNKFSSTSQRQHRKNRRRAHAAWCRKAFLA